MLTLFLNAFKSNAAQKGEAMKIVIPGGTGQVGTLLARKFRATLVRLGLGGTVGDGRQYVSWIHEIDFIRAVYWIIDREHLEGAVNLAAPEPLPHKEFMAALRKAWGAPFGLSGTKWMLEIAAALHRTESELILKSRRVVPGRLLEDGFYFQYPEWPAAARELCKRFRREH